MAEKNASRSPPTLILPRGPKLRAAAQGGRNRQRHAAPAQRVSRFLLLYKELDADDGRTHPHPKSPPRRHQRKYATIIDAIYGGKRDIPIDTVIRFQDGTTQRIRTTLAVVELSRDAPIAEAAE